MDSDDRRMSRSRVRRQLVISVIVLCLSLARSATDNEGTEGGVGDGGTGNVTGLVDSKSWNRHSFTKAYLQHSQTVIQPCIWFLHDGPGSALCCLAHGELACLFHEPNTGLDDCLRMLQACFRKRMSDLELKLLRHILPLFYPTLLHTLFSISTIFYQGPLSYLSLSRNGTDALNYTACHPPAVEEFPEDLFTADQRESGAIFVHVAAAVYLIIALGVSEMLNQPS